MSDHSQLTLKSFPGHLLTKKDRLLLEYLEEGPRNYAEIVNYLEELGVSKRTSNRLLNKNMKEKRILRIETGNNVFYTVNVLGRVKDEEVKFLIEAMKACALQTEANAKMINALRDLYESAKRA